MSLAVVASAVVVALGASIADPLIGLAITLAITRITCCPIFEQIFCGVCALIPKRASHGGFLSR